MPTAYVDFKGNFAPLLSQSRVAGATAGGNVTAGFTAAFKRFAAPVAVAGLAVGAFKLGETFKQSYNIIRVGTGQTGKALQGLEKDFRAVAANRPTEFKVTADAITDLNKRLGLTGKPLQDLTTQFLRLSGITKTDAKTNIAAVTRAFGDWEVKTEDQTETLDLFFRASQASGASVEELASKVVQFGAPLRQVGFSIEESTALFAQFEKAGVNTQTMMPGLRKALGTFLKEGRDPGEALQETFRGIQDGTIGAADAIGIFGQRAGADMVEAIKQGRFNLEDFTDSIVNGSDTIEQAAKDTSTLSGKLSTLKNKVLIGLEPIATGVYSAINNGMAAIVPIAGTAAGALGEVFSVLFKGDFTGGGPFAEDAPFIAGLFRVRRLVLDVVAAVKERLQPIWEGITSFLDEHASTAWAALASAIGVVVSPLVIGALVGGLGLVFSALAGIAGVLASPIFLIGALAAGFTVAYREIEPFREAVDDVAGVIRDRLAGAFEWVKETVIPEVQERLSDLGEDLRGLYDTVTSIDWGQAWENITAGASDLWGRAFDIDGMRAAIVATDWADISTAVTDGLTRAGDTAMADWFGRMWDRMWDNVANLKVGDGVWSSIVDGFESLADFAQPAIDALSDLATSVGQVIGPLWDLISAAGTALAPILRTVWPIVRTVGTVFLGLQVAMHKVAVFIVNVAAKAIGFLARNVLPAITWVIEHIVAPAISFLVDAWLWAWTKIGGAVSWAWNTIIQPLWNLLSIYVREVLIPMWGRVWDAVKNAWDRISGAISWAWGLISPILGQVVAYIRDEVQWRFELFKTAVLAVWDAVSTAIGDAWTTISGVFTFIKDGITGVKDWISDRIDDVIGIFDGIGERMGDVASVLTTPFRTAFGAIRSAWNTTIGSFEWSFTVPDIPGVPFRGETISIDFPNIPALPEFHRGGVIPGRRGSDVPIMGQAGELVIDRASSRELLAGGMIDYQRLGAAVAAALREEPPVLALDGETLGRNDGLRRGLAGAGRRF